MLRIRESDHYPPPAASHTILGRANPWLAIRRRQAWLRDRRHVDTRRGHRRADRARSPPHHHRVRKPEAACYAKIIEKLCLMNINTETRTG